MNHNLIKPKRIGIDARFYGSGFGLGRYTQEVVDGLAKLDQENEYVIFLRKDNFDSFSTDNPKVKKVLADARWYTLAEQIMMPLYIWREKLDLMHFQHFNVPVLCPVKYIVTIHDLILVRYPTRRASLLGPVMYFIKNLAYKFVIWMAIKRSRKVIAVSEFTKNDILAIYKISPEKISVVLEGVTESIENGTVEDNDKNTLLRYNITSPYLIYVGNAYPHKNLEFLVESFAKIREKFPQLSLVLVGKIDYFYQQLKNFTQKVINSPVETEKMPIIFTGFVPDNDLEVLYRQAAIYVFPSFYEGFGLPPLEAMSKGLPVVSSNASCLPEILGDAALYFDPANAEDLLEKISIIMENSGAVASLKEKGYKQAKKYHWRDCVLAVRREYDKIFHDENNEQK